MDEIVLGFPPLQQALESICDLEDHQFAILRDEVRGSKGFSRSIERCESIARKLKSKFGPRDVFNILTSLQFLYDNARKWELSERSGHDALNEFLEFTGLNQSVAQKVQLFHARLAELIAVNPAVQRRRKIRRLKTSLLDTAVDFASFLDLRPSFTEDRTSIDEIVPVAILRIGIKTEYGSGKSCVVQMSVEGLTKLRATLDDLDKKVLAAKNNDAVGHLLQTATVDEKDEES